MFGLDNSRKSNQLQTFVRLVGESKTKMEEDRLVNQEIESLKIFNYKDQMTEV